MAFENQQNMKSYTANSLRESPSFDQQALVVELLFGGLFLPSIELLTVAGYLRHLAVDSHVVLELEGCSLPTAAAKEPKSSMELMGVWEMYNK